MLRRVSYIPYDRGVNLNFGRVMESKLVITCGPDQTNDAMDDITAIFLPLLFRGMIHFQAYIHIS